MKDKLEKRISSYRNKTRNVSREVSVLKIKSSGLIPKLNSTVNDNNSDETDNAADNSNEDENFNNTEDDTNNSTDNGIDDSTIDLDNDDSGRCDLENPDSKIQGKGQG